MQIMVLEWNLRLLHASNCCPAFLYCLPLWSCSYAGCPVINHPLGCVMSLPGICHACLPESPLLSTSQLVSIYSFATDDGTASWKHENTAAPKQATVL